jgi:hypothetical protein
MRVYDLTESLLGPDHHKQYETLNDKYPAGDTEIWYAIGRRPQIDKNDITKSHVLVGKVQETNPKKIFGMMQGELLSPQGEAGTLLRNVGADHTSMHDGDIIRTTDRAFVVDGSNILDIQTGEKV